MAKVSYICLNSVENLNFPLNRNVINHYHKSPQVLLWQNTFLFRNVNLIKATKYHTISWIGIVDYFAVAYTDIKVFCYDFSAGKGEKMKSAEYYIMKPKVDFCFKELMKDPYVRCGFIAALLRIRPEEIKETSLLPTIMEKKYEDGKAGILDVRVLMENGTQIDIEIQVAPYALWPERSVFYISKMMVDQIHEGEGYDAIAKCIHVGILDFVLFEEAESFYSCFHLREDTRHTLYTDKVEIHILELAKLRNHEYPETELLDWAKFLNAERKEEFKEMAEKSEYISKAYENLLNISADERKRLEYEAREKAIRDHNSFMKYNLEAGRQAGLQEGRQEGAVLKLITQVLRKSQKGQNPEEIAEDLLEEPEIIQKIYRVITQNPEDSELEIFQKLNGRKE